jgi:ketosteroid isomerase-like protein
MVRSILGLTLALAGVAAPCAVMASDRSDVVAVVQAYNDAGNRSDRTGYASYCTRDATVIDHVPPYRFQGPTACADEYDAVVAWGAANKAHVEGMVQLVLDPAFLEVHGERAYAVFPVEARFKQSGRPTIEKSYLTAVLRRQGTTWGIENLIYSSLGWSPGKQHRR